MYEIAKSGTEFEITNYPWDENGYKPKTTVNISYNDEGYHLTFTSYETEILNKRTEHNTDIHRDCCMEFFAQFDPENDKRYICIEINANGAVYNSLSLNRYEFTNMPSSDIEILNVKTQVLDDRWIVDYFVPVTYIQKFIPSYKHDTGNVIRANFYKCGDDFKYPHFGCFSNITWDHPDFHRPEFFAEFKLS